MSEIRLNELLNKIYYEYLNSQEAEEFIIYFKSLKNQLQQKENIIKEAKEYLPKIRRSVSYELDDKIDNLEEILDKGE